MRSREFFLHEDGTVVLLPKLPVTVLRGMIKPRKPTVTLDDMAEAAAFGAADAVPGGRS